MNELWIKKTIWRRYLIDDDDIDAVKEEIKRVDTAEESIGDYYDKNGTVEYDNEEIVYPIEFDIQEIK